MRRFLPDCPPSQPVLAQGSGQSPDGSKSTFNEFAPFARVFLFKQQDGGTPVSLAVSGQFFLDDYYTNDSGHYVQVGTTGRGFCE